MVMREQIVELRGVTKAFGKKVILNNVDLKVYEGEAIGVIGHSGTGKSTILRLVAGLLPRSRRSVHLRHKTAENRRTGEDSLGVGLVFQQSGHFLTPSPSGKMSVLLSIATQS
jgi:phospholipid/cholesterol/gamma-HCH transport system ATP-binding protein